uniref:Putative secreted protein n=1 Tax=Anopheles marajoara TaxID=58244 RepID=A0A2M4CD97_9DIPT
MLCLLCAGAYFISCKTSVVAASLRKSREGAPQPPPSSPEAVCSCTHCLCNYAMAQANEPTSEGSRGHSARTVHK